MTPPAQDSPALPHSVPPPTPGSDRSTVVDLSGITKSYVMGDTTVDALAGVDLVIREGEIYLLPKGVPHSPQRSAGTVGLVIEQKRPEGAFDRLRWYCDSCHEQVHEATFTLQNIAVDLKRIMEELWTNDALRTCVCGAKVEQPGEAQPPAGA